MYRSLPSPALLPAEFCDAVAAVIDRLGAPRIHIAARWQDLAARCGVVEATSHASPALLVLADPDELLELVSTHSGEIGFATVGSATTGAWPRRRTTELDPTMGLWRDGWSPLNVARIPVATDDGRLELVVGDARRTPQPVSPSSAG